VSPNLSAFLRVIREGESNQSDDAFALINGGGHLTDFSKHPYAGLKTTEGGRASGAYQVIPSTWGDFCAATGHNGTFTPEAQTSFAVWRIEWRGATAAVEAGDLPRAVNLLRDEWISLPTMDPQRVMRVFAQYGGVSAAAATQPAAPIEEIIIPPLPAAPKEAPMGAGLILGLIQSILPMFTGGAQAQLGPILSQVAGIIPGAVPPVSGSREDAILKLASDMMATILKISGVANPATATDAQKIQATAAVMADPKKVQAVEVDAVTRLEAMTPVLDRMALLDKAVWDAEEASRTAAAERNAQMASAPEGPFLNPAFLLSMVVLTMVGFVVFSVLWKDAIMWSVGATEGMGFSSDMQAFVIGSVVGAALTAIINYFLGSTKSSGAKDVIINELAKKK
jgi:muramidase (phage lysozyme)